MMKTKRNYSAPKLEIELFTANHYCTNCSDTTGGAMYAFKCNADRGTLYYYPTSDGTIDGNYTGDGNAQRIGEYHPCGETHSASVTADFYDGFVDRNWNKKCDDGEGVIVWRGENKDNGHATSNLNMSTWEKNHS